MTDTFVTSPPGTEGHGPLSGIRVLDLTAVLLGPLSTQILGDLGAEVIKVESPEGDLMRFNGTSKNAGMSSIFLAANRNKRSLAVDLKKEEGLEVLLKLAQSVDVLVHNMRPDAMERLGLGYEAIRAVNSKIVYCMATGFGQDGPHRSRPAFDDIVQAACGIASLMGEDDGTPKYVPSLVADKTAGILLANAVLAAIVHRLKTGHGQYVEVPMLEALVEFTMLEHMGGRAFHPPVGSSGYGRIMGGGRRPQPTADGFIAILPYGPSHWRTLFERLDRLDLIERYPIHDRSSLNSVVRDLYRELAAITPLHTTSHWVELCDSLDIPVTPIYGIDDLPEHPHLKAVDLFQLHRHPTEGLIRMIRPAVRFSATPASVRFLAPILGQHSEEVLMSAGYSEVEISNLLRHGVVHQAATDPSRPTKNQ